MTSAVGLLTHSNTRYKYKKCFCQTQANVFSHCNGQTCQ